MTVFNIHFCHLIISNEIEILVLQKQALPIKHLVQPFCVVFFAVLCSVFCAQCCLYDISVFFFIVPSVRI